MQEEKETVARFAGYAQREGTCPEVVPVHVADRVAYHNLSQTVTQQALNVLNFNDHCPALLALCCLILAPLQARS